MLGKICHYDFLKIGQKYAQPLSVPRTLGCLAKYQLGYSGFRSGAAGGCRLGNKIAGATTAILLGGQQLIKGEVQGS